jgi:hypothetical protein
MRLPVAFLGFLTLLDGCATPHERLAAAKVCCQGPQEFKYSDFTGKAGLRLSVTDE